MQRVTTEFSCNKLCMDTKWPFAPVWRRLFLTKAQQQLKKNQSIHHDEKYEIGYTGLSFASFAAGSDAANFQP